jgi:hypothetical protein
MASALLRRLRRNLADLIDPEGDRQREPAPKSHRAVTAEALYDRLRILVPAGRPPSAKSGQVNLISIARIKERLGAQWPHHAVNADRIARNAIERYLLPGDIYARWKDAGYIVVFATLDLHQAQIKCMLIGDEITKKLLGEEEPDLADVHGVEVQADGELSFSTLPDFEQLVASTVGEAPHESGIAKIDGIPIGHGSVPMIEMEIMPAGPAAPAGDPLAEISYRFRPSWDPARGVIAAYLCVPELPEGPSGRRRYAPVVLGDDANALERLDFAVLHDVIGVLDGLVRAKRRLLVTAPVRFETLTSAAHRRHYIDTLAARLTTDAAALLVIELVSVPDGVPQARLLEITSPLRAHARAVIARLRPDTAEFGQFAGSRLAAVGCDLTRQTGSELALMQQMARFSRGAAKAGIATYLRGIRSLSLATAALGAGFAHVDGDAIAAPVDLPRGIVEFSLFDLYNPSVKA